MSNLESLALFDVPVTDDGLTHLASLTKLRNLVVTGTTITDDGLKHLAGLTQLEELGLMDARITAAGGKHLSAIKSLKRLVVGPNADEAELRKILPNCRVGDIVEILGGKR